MEEKIEIEAEKNEVLEAEWLSENELRNLAPREPLDKPLHDVAGPGTQRT